MNIMNYLDEFVRMSFNLKLKYLFNVADKIEKMVILYVRKSLTDDVLILIMTKIGFYTIFGFKYAFQIESVAFIYVIFNFLNLNF
jgi:hypothetical protein